MQNAVAHRTIKRPDLRDDLIGPDLQGIRLDQIDDCFMLKRLPGIFAAGEMLDWEAPTGGYLLQACFATGVAAAEGVLRSGQEGADQSTGTA